MNLERAIELAAKAHAGQVDKGGEPYILHPLRVMLAVPPEARVVAVLHDVAEDRGWEAIPANELSAAEVGALVALTRRRLNEIYWQYIDRVAADPLARQVKIQDLLDNLDPRRRAAISEDQALRYMDALVILRQTERSAPEGNPRPIPNPDHGIEDGMEREYKAWGEAMLRYGPG